MGETFSEPGVFPAGRKNSFALEHSPTSVFIYECVFWIKGAQQDFLSFHGHLICFALLFLSFPARTLCHRPAPLFLLPLRPLTGAAQGLGFLKKVGFQCLVADRRSRPLSVAVETRLTRGHTVVERTGWVGVWSGSERPVKIYVFHSATWEDGK